MKIQPTKESELIDFVKFNTSNAIVGEPVSVAPVLNHARCGTDTMVSINGVPGVRQTLQFANAGTKKIHIVAFTMEGGRLRTIDQETIEIEIGEAGDSTASCRGFRPIVQGRQVPEAGLTIEFQVENADALEAEDAVYQWEIDGDQQVVTRSPKLRWNFEDNLAADSPYTTFEVSVRATSKTGETSAPGRRTVSGWNRDYMNRQRGIVELKTEGIPEVVRDGDEYSVSYKLSNPGKTTVEIDTRQLEFLLTTESSPTPLREPARIKFSIPPSGSVSRTFSIPVDEVPNEMFGIALHFFGEAEPDFEAFGNIYAEVRHNHPLAVPVADPDLIDIIDNVDARLPGGLENQPVRIPDLIGNGIDRADGCSPAVVLTGTTPDKSTVMNALPGLSEFSSEEREGDPAMIPMSGHIPVSDDAVEGDPCFQFQDPPEEGLACQLTDEYEEVYIPGRLLNARKGDVILSPGSGSAIAELLMKVDPMEIYSHSGIMTSDYLQVRHSTASTNWLEKQKAGEFLGNEGTEGLSPTALKYAWPGTVTQTIDQAFEGSDFTGPDGNHYEITGFSNEISNNSTVGAIWPEVVKPDPRIEYEMPELRPLLNKVADAAAEIEGHYRFYAYTDASIFFERASIGGWLEKDTWWDQTRPTVCSSLIWGAIKSLEDPPPLEQDEPPLTARDLEQDDVGAMVQPNTPDGLYFYTEEERKTAAQWLYNHFYNLAEEQAGSAGKIFTDAPDDLANQVTNAFAFDWTGENDEGTHAKDSDEWKNPGSGNAVSPDTIRDYWDEPSIDEGRIEGLYGHFEKLVYRPGRIETRRVRRWKRVEPEKATLQVEVLYDGDRLAHATVEVAGQTKITDENGEATVSMSGGSYTVHAHKNQDGWYLSKKKEVQLDSGGTNTVTVSLDEPPEMYRLIGVSGTMELLDDDWFNNPRDKNPLIPSLARVGPHSKENTLNWKQTVDGEVTGKLRINFEWQPDGSIMADIWIGLFQDGDKELDESGSIVIGKDETRSFSGELKSGGVDNPHAWFNGTIKNGQASY